MRKAAYGSGLTSRQHEVLEFIKRTVAAEGFPPTRIELAEHFGWKSPNAADEHIRALERKGVITLTKGAARGITLTKAAGGLPSPVSAMEAELQAWRKTFPEFYFEPSTGGLTRPGPRFTPSDKPCQPKLRL